jgi:hypothetical protein
MSYSRTVRCSYCFQNGHNRRTCPELSEFTARQWRASKSNYERALNDGKTEMVDLYKRRMDNYADLYAKRTGRDVATGNDIVMTKEAKKAAKAKRMANVRCSYCGNTGHTRRTCQDLKDDKQVYLKALLDKRIDALNKMRELGVGVGSLAKMQRYGYWPDKENGGTTWGSRERPMLLRAINWPSVRPHNGALTSLYHFHDAAQLCGDGDHYSWTDEGYNFVANAVANGSLTPSGTINPPDGWFEGKDVDMSYEFPPGKLRDWAYRDAHNRILTDDPPSSHNTELYNARKSLGI